MFKMAFNVFAYNNNNNNNIYLHRKEIKEQNTLALKLKNKVLAAYNNHSG